MVFWIFEKQTSLLLKHSRVLFEKNMSNYKFGRQGAYLSEFMTKID